VTADDRHGICSRKNVATTDASIQEKHERQAMKNPMTLRPFPFFAPDLFAEAANAFRPFLAETETSGEWTPRADFVETPEAYVVHVDTPGISPNDITVTLTGDVLMLKGEKAEEEKREDDNWHITERRYGAFSRSFRLPAAVKTEDVLAEIKDGVLTVKVLKAKEATPKRIKVRSS
jgi:HSP20 family protein